VADPSADVNPMLDCAVDWEATLAFRRHVYGLGLAVAEAMDTAQRGMGMSWKATKELIERSLRDARTIPGARIGCGVGTDQLAPSPRVTLDEVEGAYEEQIEWVERHGGQVILMASRALAGCAGGPGTTLASGGSRQVVGRDHPLAGRHVRSRPRGYWGSPSLDIATDVLLAVRDHAAKVDGVKLALDQKRRSPCAASSRRACTCTAAMTSIIRPRSGAMSAATATRPESSMRSPSRRRRRSTPWTTATCRATRRSSPTLPLSRHLFGSPTRFYKTGVVFVAYLNGHQSHFHMVGGLESARSVVHLGEIFRLADQAGILRDPDRATERMRRVLAVAGVDE
jgi:hypothetical protein